MKEEKFTDQVNRKEHSVPATYALHHSKSKKFYVGSTEDFYVRVNQHRTKLEAGKHRNKNLQAAFDEDPKLVLAFVPQETKDEALMLEQRVLDRNFASGKLFNISPDARVSGLGVALSEERKEQLKQSTTEQFSSPEAREKHSAISRKLWEDPAYREKQQAGAGAVDQELRSSKLTSSLKEKWQDPSYRLKMEEDRHQRKRAVLIEGVEYPCLKDASQATSLAPSTIVRRLKSESSKFTGYSYISKQDQTS